MVDTEAPQEGEEQAKKPSLNVRKGQLEKALKALSQVIAKQQADNAVDLGAKPLFDSASKSMHLIFQLTWMPEKRLFTPRLLRLPHPMYTDQSEVCLLCKDDCKKMYKELFLQDKKVPGVTKVIAVSKLLKEYKEGKDRQMLRDTFDLFVCDDRVYQKMWELLGVNFKSGNKYPVPIRIRTDEEDPTPKVRKAMGSTLFKPTEGMQVNVRFGRSNMSQEELLQNAVAVIKSAIPQLADNPVQKICVQGHDTPMLPIWCRPKPDGMLNLKRYKADASSASETGSSRHADTEDTGSSIEVTSDAGETISVDLSTGDATSELETATDTLSDMDSHQEEIAVPTTTKSKKRRKASIAQAEVEEVEEVEEAAPAEKKSMPPPSKKAKKKQSAR
mmetsp:Transcript_68027/g.127036  ORF Transcript_68027/g.127036 Transcript_68027/m.127036 type:complete len:388 (+) Transcript_68027:26-1189(+)